MKRASLLVAIAIALGVNALASVLISTPVDSSQYISSAAVISLSCCGGDPGGGGPWPFAPTKRLQSALPESAMSLSCCGGDPGGGGPWPYAPTMTTRKAF